MAKSQQVKFEVGQLVEFNNRVGQVSRIAKNGAIYVIVIGEPQGADQPSEELRVKKADLQLIEEIKEPVAQQEIELAWACADAVQEIVPQQASVVQESIPPMGEPIQSAVDSAEESQSVALADATYALRELTFSVTRHSILTAFIDVALNKNIPGYHYQVTGNLKNLMAAAFDPVHDAIGYARIDTWTMAALELVVKNKERIAKMLSQPIEAAPIKMDRVTKLGMWIDNMMNNKGPKVNDMTSAYDSCYTYDALGKKLEACSFVVVEAMQAMDSDTVKILPIACAPVYYPEYVTAQSAIQMRQRFIRYHRNIKPGMSSYCGIVPIRKTGLSMQAAIDDTLASVIDGLKGITELSD